MSFSSIRQKIKPWMLPIAMLAGIIFHNYIGYVAFLSKYLIFIMLLITYCRVKLSDFKAGPFIWLELGVQLIGSVAVYLAIAPFNELLAQGVFICIFCPTATAAPVITGMLGGKVARTATYSLFSHVSVALLAPLLLSWMAGADPTAPSDGISFGESVETIAWTVLPLILGPLALAALMQRFAPRVRSGIANHQGLSFYIWALALLIVVGNSVSFILKEPATMIPVIILLSGGSFVACVAQFAIGRRIGSRYGDRISGAQSLGQKNTVFAIWLALTYLNPVVSIAPASYVAWHNTINSYQIYRHETQSKVKQKTQPKVKQKTQPKEKQGS